MNFFRPLGLAALSTALIATHSFAESKVVASAAVVRASPDDLIESLPPELPDAARRIHSVHEFGAARDSTTQAVYSIASRPEAAEFLLAELSDPACGPNKARMILGVFGRQSYLAGNRKAMQTFANIAAGSETPATATAARAALKNLFSNEEIAHVRNGLDSARRIGDTALVTAMMDTLEETIIRNDDVSLPRYLRKPPPVFVAKPASQSSIRVLTLGDFGASRGVETQIQVARSIQKIHKQKKFDIGLTLGDNFYGAGLNDPAHPRWKTQWEDLYTPLGIPFYASLGNHDWGDPSSPPSEVEYTRRSKSWKMPAIYYTYIAGPIQFFVIETDIADAGDEKQLEWLRSEIDKSKAPWKVVYGHFPLRTQVERDGKIEVVEETGLKQHLMPVIENKINVYFAGHHHSQQHHKPFGGFNQFICGSSGYKIYPVGSTLDPTVNFAWAGMGFTAIDATRSSFTVTYYNQDGVQIYTTTLKK